MLGWDVGFVFVLWNPIGCARMGEIESLMNPGLFVRKPSQTARAKIGEGTMGGSDVVAGAFVVVTGGSTTLPANVPLHFWHCCIQSPMVVHLKLEQWRDGWTQSGAGTRRGP